MQTIIEPHRQTNIYKRQLFHVFGVEPGPIIVFFGGIHGNEPAGVEAINNVLGNIDKHKVKGEIYAFAGNIKALRENKRFIASDLNRMWTEKDLNVLRINHNLNEEEQEQVELFHCLNNIIAQHKGKPLYFIDLHTTSSKSLPFITINDALINRKFSQHFPVPIVLGIEEYLDGPLLSYLNTMGFVSLGFESGQHTDPQSIKNAEAFIVLALQIAGILTSASLDTYRNYLQEASRRVSSPFEVVYKYDIKPNEHFKMKEGFESFQDIKRGTLLATSDGTKIYSYYNAQLFMPLYQKTGNDGFFIIKKIPIFFLKLSEWLRTIKADQFLTWLPGICWHHKEKGILKANLKVARFLTKSIFHLLGYRNKHVDKTHLLLYNRERVANMNIYRNEKWYKKSPDL